LCLRTCHDCKGTGKFNDSSSQPKDHSKCAGTGIIYRRQTDDAAEIFAESVTEFRKQHGLSYKPSDVPKFLHERESKLCHKCLGKGSLKNGVIGRKCKDCGGRGVDPKYVKEVTPSKAPKEDGPTENDDGTHVIKWDKFHAGPDQIGKHITVGNGGKTASCDKFGSTVVRAEKWAPRNARAEGTITKTGGTTTSVVVGLVSQGYTGWKFIINGYDDHSMGYNNASGWIGLKDPPYAVDTKCDVTQNHKACRIGDKIKVKLSEGVVTFWKYDHRVDDFKPVLTREEGVPYRFTIPPQWTKVALAVCLLGCSKPYCRSEIVTRVELA